MSVMGIGTIEYGRAYYPYVTLPRRYSTLVSAVPAYAMTVMSDLPIAYWRMDEAYLGTLLDFSGFQRHLITTGNYKTFSSPLVTGGRSKGFGAGVFASASIESLLVAGREASGFTIEAWVQTDRPSTERLIMGRTGDGLFVVPGGYEFRVRSTNGTTYRSFYPVTDWSRSYHIAGIYNARQLTLIANGDVMSSELLEGSFINTSNNWFLAGTDATTVGTLIVDELAVYRKALPLEVLSYHYRAGKAKPSYEDVIISSGGIYWPLDDSTTEVSLKHNEGTVYEGVYVSEPIDLSELLVVDGSRLDWTGSADSTIEYSRNLGGTWTLATNGLGVTGLTNTGFIQFRRTIPAGGSMDFMRFTVWSNRDFLPVNAGAEARVNGDVIPSSNSTEIVDNLVGARVNPSGSIRLDSTVDFPVWSFSFWLKRRANSTASDLIITTPGGNTSITATEIVFTGSHVTAVYVNGQQRDQFLEDMPVGEWVHVALTSSGMINGTIAIGKWSTPNAAPMNIAHFATFNRELSADEIRAQVNAGFSREYLAALDTNTIQFTDSPSENKVYSLDWEVVSNA